MFLSKVEKAYLNGTTEFTKPQIRYIKCRLKKKLRRLDEQGCNAATLLQRLEAQRLQQPTIRSFREEISSNNIIISNSDSNTERGSPSLVGRGIANPMSERTRGFEMS